MTDEVVDTSEESFEHPQPIPAPAPHCCQCSEEKHEPCLHMVGRLLCREHGAPLQAAEFNPPGFPIVREMAPREIDLPVADAETEPFDIMDAIDAAALLPVYLKPICSGCGEYLDHPGALLFSPPDEDGKCDKLHVCRDCFALVIAPFRG